MEIGCTLLQQFALIVVLKHDSRNILNHVHWFRLGIFERKAREYSVQGLGVWPKNLERAHCLIMLRLGDLSELKAHVPKLLTKLLVEPGELLINTVHCPLPTNQ
jgi:hypothetical protein